MDNNITSLYLLGVVGADFYANDFIREINATTTDEIHLHINSPGGGVYDSIAIVHALQAHPAKVTAYIEGIAASSASFIAIGGSDKVIIRPNAEIMIHEAWQFVEGNSKELKKAIDNLDRLTEKIAGFYQQKAGGDINDWLEIMSNDKYYTAEEALQAGLVDAIEEAHSNRPVNMTPKALEVMASMRSKPIEPIETKDDNMNRTIKNIARKLGIQAEEVTEDMIYEALDEVLNEAEEERKALFEDELPSDFTKADSTPKNEETEDNTDSEDVEDTSPKDGETLKGEEPTSDEEPKAEVKTITLDEVTYLELVEAAKAGAQRLEEQKAEKIANTVDTWINEGRISASRREDIINQVTEGGDKVASIYAQIPANTIPRKPLGTSKTPETPKDVNNLIEGLFQGLKK